MDRHTTDQKCPSPNEHTDSRAMGTAAEIASGILARQSAELHPAVVTGTGVLGAAGACGRLVGTVMNGTTEKHLPPMEIKDSRFDAIATSMMSRLDVNEDGRVTRNELKDFVDHPTKFDKQSTRDAVKLMYDNYQFLRELSIGPDGHSGEHSPGINASGIHRAYNLANGRGVAPDARPVVPLGSALGSFGSSVLGNMSKPRHLDGGHVSGH